MNCDNIPSSFKNVLDVREQQLTDFESIEIQIFIKCTDQKIDKFATTKILGHRQHCVCRRTQVENGDLAMLWQSAAFHTKTSAQSTMQPESYTEQAHTQTPC